MQSEVFHVSRSSDGQREWYSARDAATGVSIPCECKDRAISLVTSLNSAFKHHLTAALVDVPAVEPDYWTSHHNFEHMLGKGVTDEKGGVVWDFALQTWVNADVPLYTKSPLREGEDSAEVERLRGLLSRAEEYVIDGVTNAKAEAEMNAPYPARAPRYDAALAEVRQLYADIQATLAATRSGSALNAAGGRDGD